LRGKKSFLGCFHPPESVLIDPELLRTLPKRFLIARPRRGAEDGRPRATPASSRWSSAVPRSWWRPVSRSPPPMPPRCLQRLHLLDAGGAGEQFRSRTRTYERLVDFGHTFSSTLESALCLRHSPMARRWRFDRSLWRLLPASRRHSAFWKAPRALASSRPLRSAGAAPSRAPVLDADSIAAARSRRRAITGAEP